MNNVNIIGNITKDIELRYTQNQKSVTTVTLAINEGYGDNQKTHFIDIQVWEKQAENLKKYCGKGSKIAVSGKLIQQTWEHEGKNKNKVLVQAFNIMFLDNKKEEQTQAPELSQAEITKSVMNEESDPWSEFNSENQDELDSLPF
jgi:single-strand DNA-binding protein